MSQFLRDQASDSDEVVTPLMLDGTYLSRNFATLGPTFWQPPCICGRGWRLVQRIATLDRFRPASGPCMSVSVTTGRWPITVTRKWSVAIEDSFTGSYKKMTAKGQVIMSSFYGNCPKNPRNLRLIATLHFPQAIFSGESHIWWSFAGHTLALLNKLSLSERAQAWPAHRCEIQTQKI